MRQSWHRRRTRRRLLSIFSAFLAPPLGVPGNASALCEGLFLPKPLRPSLDCPADGSGTQDAAPLGGEERRGGTAQRRPECLCKSLGCARAAGRAIAQSRCQNDCNRLAPCMAPLMQACAAWQSWCTATMSWSPRVRAAAGRQPLLCACDAAARAVPPLPLRHMCGRRRCWDARGS